MPPQNLLFILSDEHQRSISGCYGNSIVQTPNIDALAARGVRFENAYTNCPICVPARASLATGRYVNQIGYWDNAFPYEGHVPGWGYRLIEQGHRVDSIGKLHYRSADDADGFSDHLIPLNVVDGIGDVMGAIRDNPPVRRGGRDGITGAGPGESTYLNYDVDIAEAARRWLHDAAERRQAGQVEKPWVAFVSFVCPHPPFIAPPDLFEHYWQQDLPWPVQNQPDEWPRHSALDILRHTMQYDAPFTADQVRRVTAAYYGACTHLDRQIGKVLQALEETGLSDNTRIIYTSDHGENLGNRGLWGKFTMYEESAGVPFIMAGPDVPQGQVSTDVISLVDCYPTILDCVGVAPSEAEQDLPGTSLWPLAKGQSLERAAFSEYHAVGSTGGWYMLRHRQYKYVHYIGAADQLFDLNADPQELHNLADDAEYQDVLHDMHKRLCEVVDPVVADANAKADQAALVERYGGRESVLNRGTFINSPCPGETPKFHTGGA